MKPIAEYHICIQRYPDNSWMVSLSQKGHRTHLAVTVTKRQALNFVDRYVKEKRVRKAKAK